MGSFPHVSRYWEVNVFLWYVRYIRTFKKQISRTYEDIVCHTAAFQPFLQGTIGAACVRYVWIAFVLYTLHLCWCSQRSLSFKKRSYSAGNSVFFLSIIRWQKLVWNKGSSPPAYAARYLINYEKRTHLNLARRYLLFRKRAAKICAW